MIIIGISTTIITGRNRYSTGAKNKNTIKKTKITLEKEDWKERCVEYVGENGG